MTCDHCLHYLGLVPFLTQWFLSSPKNCTPRIPYRHIKNRKKVVTLIIWFRDRLCTGVCSKQFTHSFTMFIIWFPNVDKTNVTKFGNQICCKAYLKIVLILCLGNWNLSFSLNNLIRMSGRGNLIMDQ